MSFPVRVSLCGNVAALVLLASLLFDATRLFESAFPRPRSPMPESDPVVTTPLLLVVVDGLRADAADAAAMPALERLAARGARGTLVLEMLVPATLGAIVAMVEGRVAPPIAVLRDFGASAAADGGLLARLDARGARSFVAGTALWHDLYGRWIDDGLAVEGFPDLAADARIERAALTALGSDDPPELVVAHLGNVDRVAHREGGASSAYREAVAAADAAIGRLAAAAGGERLVIVTADHGTTADGGHAGPERSVREVPLVIAGPNAPSARSEGLRESVSGDGSGVGSAGIGSEVDGLGRRPQSALPALIAVLSGYSDTSRHTIDAAAAQHTGSSWSAVLWGVALALAALLLLVALDRSADLSIEAFWLSAALWASLAASALAGGRVGAIVAAGALVLAATRHARVRPEPRSIIVCLAALAYGALAAGLRLVDAGGAEGAGGVMALAGAVPAIGAFVVAVTGRHGFPPAARGEALRVAGVLFVLVACALWLGGGVLAMAVALGVVAGWRLARGARPLFVGIALALLPGTLARFAGETVSLSSIDVAIAHRLVDTPLGLGGAIAATILRTALPALALAGGWVAAGVLPGSGSARMCAALAAAHAGAGLVFFAALASGVPDASPVHALGLGGLLRELNELCWVVLGIGLGAWGWSAARVRSRAAILPGRSDVSSGPRPADPPST